MSTKSIDLVHRLLEAQAEKQPEAIAIVSGDVIMTYAELNRRANIVAQRILQHSLPRESSIGIFMECGLNFIVAMFGILKSGCSYTPLEPSLPTARLSTMCADCNMSLIVYEESCKCPLSDIEHMDIQSGDAAAPNPTVEISERDLAYTIFTSGSTGTPKGVMVEHASLVNFAVAQTAAFPVHDTSRVLQFSSAGFDAATSDIVTAVAAGARIIEVDKETSLSPKSLARLVAEHSVDIITLPPSVLTTLDPVDFPSLAVVVSIGQHCTATVVDRWAGMTRLINGYGPTEATIGTTLGLQHVGIPPHIGRPLQNTAVYILDENFDPVPVGSVGEIYIGGIGVARGYLNLPELTKERFMDDRFSDRAGAKMVRTFDRARFGADGNIEIFGRVDRVVKLHGQRIDLDEVEIKLQECARVSSCAVIFVNGDSYDDRLVAFVVSDDFDVRTFRSHLSEHLPAYMVPHTFLELDAMPLSAAGKTDYEKLLDNDKACDHIANFGDSPVTNRVLDMIGKLLSQNKISNRKSFVELGGDSMSAVRLINRIQAEWNIEVTIDRILNSDSVLEFVTSVVSEIDGQNV